MSTSIPELFERVILAERALNDAEEHADAARDERNRARSRVTAAKKRLDKAIAAQKAAEEASRQ